MKKSGRGAEGCWRTAGQGGPGGGRERKHKEAVETAEKVARWEEMGACVHVGRGAGRGLRPSGRTSLPANRKNAVEIT